MRIGWCLLPWANQRHGKENGYLSDPEPARASELATTCTKRRLRVSAARVATLTACAGARSFDEQVHGADLSARFKSLPHPVDAYGTYALARPLITADVHFEALVAWRKAAMAHFSRPAVQDRRKIRKKAGRQASQGIFRVLPEPKSSQRNLPRCRQPPSPSERMSTPPTVAHSAAAPAVEPKHKSPRVQPSPNVERRREAGHQRQHARRHPARVLHMDSLPAASSGTARRQPEPEGTPNGKKPMPHWLHRVAIARSALDAKRRKATERTHLLDSKPGQESVIEKLVYGETDAEALVGFNRELAATEFRPLSMLAAQMLVSNMIDFFPGFLSGVLTGHLSTTMSSEYIAARSLAGVFMMITGYTVNIAIGAAMDTLCAQAYGAGKLREMGIFFQTGLLLFAGCFVPVSLVSYFCVDILELLGQRREIAQLVYRLVLYVLPSLPFSIVNSLLCKILQGQNIIKPMVYAGIVANVVHGVLIYVFMFHTSVGYAGSSLANSALVACYTLTLAIYFCRSHLYQREWPGWRLRDALALVPEFVRLGFSGLCMFIFEYWGFAAASLLAGLLPYAAVAISADSTYSSFRVLCAQFYGTISIAGSVRVGNALGANDPERAKTAAFLSVGLSVICALLTSIVMVGLRGIYPFAYTTDAAVVAATSRLMLLTCPFQIFFGISASVQGIFRGSGLQVLGARLNFFCFLALAVPMGLTLAFPLGMGLLGLWFGLCTGSVASGGYCLYWLLIADWNSMAAEAQKRTQEPDDLREDEAESLKAEQELRAGDVASYC